MYKTVKHLLPSEPIDMGGIIVKQALPTEKVRQVDPFLLLHHGTFKFREDAPARHQGIGPHPHRGFSPVTFVIEGEVHHQDSRGNNQIAKEGEVQWLHAGAGIIHSERPTQAIVDKNGIQEVIQLWINSPADNKMKTPLYQYRSHDSISGWSTGDLVQNKIIAGNYKELSGSIITESDLLIIWAHATKNGAETYHLPTTHNTMLYLIKGDISIAGYGMVSKEELVVFDRECNFDEVKVTASSQAQYLILSGKPLNEKLVQQGPFVMNSETEILEAMRDYQMGKMGVLIEDY